MNQHERTAFFNFLETAVRQTDPEIAAALNNERHRENGNDANNHQQLNERES